MNTRQHRGDSLAASGKRAGDLPVNAGPAGLSRTRVRHTLLLGGLTLAVSTAAAGTLTWDGSSANNHFSLSDNFVEGRVPNPTEHVVFEGGRYGDVHFDFAQGAQNRLGDLLFTPGSNPAVTTSYRLFSDGTRNLRVDDIYNHTTARHEFHLDVVLMNKRVVTSHGEVVFYGHLDAHTGNNQITFGGTGNITFGSTATIAPNLVLFLNDQITLRADTHIESASLQVGGTSTIDLGTSGSLSASSIYVEPTGFLNIINWNESDSLVILNEPDPGSLSRITINGMPIVWNQAPLHTLTPIPEPGTYALLAGVFFLLLAVGRRRIRADRQG